MQWTFLHFSEVFIFLSHKIILRRQIASFRSFGCYCCSACIEQPPSLKRGVFPGGLQFRLLGLKATVTFSLSPAGPTEPQRATRSLRPVLDLGSAARPWPSHPGARAATGRSPEGSRRGARQTPQWPGRRPRPEEGAGWWTPEELRPEAPRSRRRTAHPQPSRFARPVAAVCAPPAGPSRFRGRTPRAGRRASTGVGRKKKSILIEREGELKTPGTVDPGLFSSSWALLGKDSD